METIFDYRLLTIFVTVVDELSFTGAAKKLGISKGTVSRAITRLEAHVGAELLHRTSRSLALSSAGEGLYEQVAPHLARLEESVSRLPERDEEPSGVLRITAPLDFAYMFLPTILGQFSRRYPKIRFETRITNASLDLVAEGIDLAIRVSAAPRDSALKVRMLGRAGMGCYIASQLAERQGVPTTLGAPSHEWIMLPALLSLIPGLDPTRVRFVCDDFLLIHKLVCQGLGVAVMPRFVARQDVSLGVLTSVPLDGIPMQEGSYYLLYPSTKQVPRKVTAFRDFLVEMVGDGLPIEIDLGPEHSAS